MIRCMLPILMILLMSAPCYGGDVPPVEVMGLLGSREQVGSVSFFEGEDRLGTAATAELDRMIPRLAAEGTTAKLVRVEGFITTKEAAANGIQLAMARAKAVEVYLRETRKVTAEIYLIGYGSTPGSQSAPRVEVALYDKLLPIGDAPVDSIIKKW